MVTSKTHHMSDLRRMTSIGKTSRGVPGLWEKRYHGQVSRGEYLEPHQNCAYQPGRPAGAQAAILDSTQIIDAVSRSNMGHSTTSPSVIRLSDMPVEVLRLIPSYLGPQERRMLSLAEFQMATGVFECYLLEATANVATAQEIHTVARQAAGPVSHTELRAITEIMEDAVTAIHRLTREEFVGSVALKSPSKLVVLAQRVVCTVLEAKFDGSPPKGPELNPGQQRRVKEAYKQLLLSQDKDSCLGVQIAALDVIWLGACLNKEVYELMASFSSIVGEDDFVDRMGEPYAEWAAVICLWLRRVSQVTAALDTSMYTSYAERILKHATKQLHETKSRHDRLCELGVLRASRESSAPPQLPDDCQSPQEYIHNFLCGPKQSRQGCTSGQFIQQFLLSGPHGTPILADRPETMLEASERLHGKWVMLSQLA